MFKVYGIEPFGDMDADYPSRQERMQGKRPRIFRSYYQNFGLLEYSPGEHQELSIINKTGDAETSLNFNHNTDFYVRTGTVGQTGEAPLVFVGYGFQDEEKTYDDLKKMDLEGKIALVLEGFPGHKDTASTGNQSVSNICILCNTNFPRGVLKFNSILLSVKLNSKRCSKFCIW